MKIIEKQGNSKLVEYEEGRSVKRVVLPITEDDISLGIPYGLPLSHLLQKSGMPKNEADRMEQKLHNAGIWTEQDLREKPGLIEALKLNLAQLLDSSIPDLNLLNWSEIQIDLGNLLESKEFYTLEDIQTRQADFLWCVKTALTKPLINLYRRNKNGDS